MDVQELIHSWWKSKVVKPFYKTVGLSHISHDTAIPFLEKFLQEKFLHSTTCTKCHVYQGRLVHVKNNIHSSKNLDMIKIPIHRGRNDKT